MIFQSIISDKIFNIFHPIFLSGWFFKERYVISIVGLIEEKKYGKMSEMW